MNMPSITSLSAALVNARSVANKTFILHDLLQSHNLDILFITESWLTVGYLSPISEIVSSDYFILARQGLLVVVGALWLF